MKRLLLFIALLTFSAPAYAVCSPLGTTTVMKVIWNANGTGVIEALDTSNITSIAEGVLAYDTATETLKVCDGSAWMTVISADASGAVAEMKLQPKSSAPVACNSSHYGMVALNNVSNALINPSLCVCANGGWKLIGGILGAGCPWS